MCGVWRMMEAAANEFCDERLWRVFGCLIE